MPESCGYIDEVKFGGGKLFLTAQWRWLAMLNYEIDPAVLAPLVPAGTELDTWNEKHYVSVVGFLFQHARVRGFSIPFHRDFEEVNLRFYVRRKAEDGWRRGVVFIKELVPRGLIAFVARSFYNENYFRLPMSHRISLANDPGSLISIRYSWQFENRDNFLQITTRGIPKPALEGSRQQFITEHYWGYVTHRDGSAKEYRVEHPLWQIWEAETAEFQCNVASLYGKQFCDFLARPPASAFLADGSDIKVYKCAGFKPPAGNAENASTSRPCDT